jgi:histidyl-tRNA synthetase
MPDATPSPAPKPTPRKIASPTGTRDFYPQDMLLRRYITDAWRRTALRHGFDEIDGPTFESADLYKVKSGEGILGEMFGVYSGKSPDDVESVKRGEPPYGLRPEFTPTLARMYAARAKQLPQPTKWFCVSNFFRAERPQRGRLREFFQWNCDVIGGEDKAGADVDVIECALSLLANTGLSHTEVKAKYSSRSYFAVAFSHCGVPEDKRGEMMNIIDASGKVSLEATRASMIKACGESIGVAVFSFLFLGHAGHAIPNADALAAAEQSQISLADMHSIAHALNARGLRDWCEIDAKIVRGLAYYTGTVFEVIAEGERAVAGGGRYDNLIELFGGPPTPACGFGMGDVVLANLLADRGLVPEGRDLLAALSQPMPVRPDVFVIASPNEHCDAAVVPLVARLRRGAESKRYAQGELKPWAAGRYTVPPMHARRSYKATKNVGKLLADANGCHARFAVIIERYEPASGQALEGHATLKDLDTQAQHEHVPLTEIGTRIAATTGWR